MIRTLSFMLLIPVLVLSSTKVAASDSTTHSRSSSTAFKQAIVQNAWNEYYKWRNDTIIREQDAAAAAMLNAYWNVVGKQFSYKQFKSYNWQEAHPWSAVFISFILQQSGAGDQFRYSETHSSYIISARQNTFEQKEQSLFQAYPVDNINAAWPEPGDIICKNRDGMNYSLNSISYGCISHCDIVVEVDTLARAIYTIGGNLGNTVAKRLLWLDENGQIDKNANWLLLDEETGNKEGSQAEIFAVIKVRNRNENLFTNTRNTIQLEAMNVNSSIK